MTKTSPGSDKPGAAGDVLVRLDGLTPEQVEQLSEIKRVRDEQREQRLDALGQALTQSRSAAVLHRQANGIDYQWQEDIEFYEGIDDANRGEMTAWRTKPPGFSMTPINTDANGNKDTRSTVFVNITRPYVDAAAARIADMLMPTDDRAFSIGPTPVPELEALSKAKTLSDVDMSVRESIVNDPRIQTEEQALSAVNALVQKAKDDLQKAKECAKRAMTRIDDWFVEGQYHAEVRKVIDDAAKIGTGVLKGPVPVKRRSTKVVSENGDIKLVVQEKIAPASRRIDPLNLFPDPACGENIHNGSHIWERDYLTRKKLMELRDMPGYLRAQIEKCLLEGPQKQVKEGADPQGSDAFDIKDRFEIWYYHGLVSREDLEALNCPCDAEKPEPSFYAILTMVNDRVIKAAFNPLDTGDFPYDVMVWQRQSGKWAGVGVSRQIRTPQRIVNGGARNMMDNAGLAGGPQIVMKLGVVEPADGNYAITPRKVWYMVADADVNDLNAVFRTYNIESRQVELMAIIQWGLKLAEDVTGLPLLLQGQQGTAPETLGGMQMLNNNSSTVLRRLAKLYDDCITEPHVRRYYVWLLLYGENNNEKGDFQIDARGSSALVERDLQNQAVIQMGSIVLNPAFRVDPSKWFAEYCKSQRLDAKSFQYTDEEWQKIQENASQGPSDPRLAVAQLRAQVEQQLLQMEQTFEAQEKDKDRNLELVLAQLEQEGTKSITLDQLRTKLAQSAMELKTQRDLSAASNAVTMRKEVTKPPTEPAGRAPAGQSYGR
jgi:hypothetical protein